MKPVEEIAQTTATAILNNQSGLTDFELVLIGFVTGILLVAAMWVIYWKYK